MKSILIVEDNEELRINLEDILTSEGYKVIIAVDGADGYERAINDQPDLIISDIQMPRMNGLDLLELLQKNQATETIPVIIFSAHSEPTYIRRGMSISADDYLTKPFKIDDLLATISARFKKKEKQFQSSDKFKNNIIKKVAHELRTPLISILSYPQLLQDNINDLSFEEIKQIAESMKISGNEMYRNVEKILLYSELLYFSENNESGDKPSNAIYKIDSAELKRSILTDLSNYTHPPGCEMDFENGIIRANADHFIFLIRELIGIIYKKTGGIDNLKILGKSRGGFYHLGISFEGKHNYDLLTSGPDEKMDNENIVGNGLGLGLMIVKRVIMLYGGSLKVESTADNRTEVLAGFCIADLN